MWCCSPEASRWSSPGVRVSRVDVRVRVRKSEFLDQDEAAKSERVGAEETEREHEKLGLRGGRKAGPLRRAHRVLEEPQRGNDRYRRGCGGCRGRCALLLSVCRVRIKGQD